MSSAILCAVVTFLASPLVARVLHRAGRHDVPNHRSSHATPTPRGGGLALLAATAVLAAVSTWQGAWSVQTASVVAGCAALSAVGLVDDLRDLRPAHRLVAQALVGVLAGFVLGGPVGALVGLLVVPAAVNMVNFMDGINGMCASHAAVWGLGALLAAPEVGQPLAVLGAISLGGGLGFLPWNMPRARLFLGDVGSYLIGGLAGMGVLATGVVLLDGDQPPAVWPLVGLVCAPYLLFAVDTTSTVVRRARAGDPLFEAHRTHVYQRLVNEGGAPHWVVSLAVAALSLLVTSAFLVSAVVGVVAALTAAALYLASPGLVRQEVTS